MDDNRHKYRNHILVALLIVIIGVGFKVRADANHHDVHVVLAQRVGAEIHAIDAWTLNLLFDGVETRALEEVLAASESALATTRLLEDAGHVSEVLGDQVAALISASDTLVAIKNEGATQDELADLYATQVRPIHFAALESVTLETEEALSQAETYGRIAAFGSSIEIALIALIAAALTRSVRQANESRSAMAEKDRFIAAVSHELRTPLSAIVALSQMMRDEDDLDQDALEEFTGIIASQSLEMSNLIEDLLLSARAEMSELSIRAEAIDVSAEVAAAVESMAKPEVEAIEREHAVDLVAFADPLRVRQIIRNLVTNAIRYGGSARRIETRRTDGKVEVRMSDSGEELDPSFAGRMFDSYVSGAGTTVVGSIGLGLAVSRSLARRMGGELAYERSGGRNHFILTLPMFESSSTDPVLARG